MEVVRSLFRAARRACGRLTRRGNILLLGRRDEVVRAEDREHLFLRGDAACQGAGVADPALTAHRIVASAKHSLVVAPEAGADVRGASALGDETTGGLGEIARGGVGSFGIATHGRRVRRPVVENRAVSKCASEFVGTIEHEGVLLAKDLIERILIEKALVVRLPIHGRLATRSSYTWLVGRVPDSKVSTTLMGVGCEIQHVRSPWRGEGRAHFGAREWGNDAHGEDGIEDDQVLPLVESPFAFTKLEVHVLLDTRVVAGEIERMAIPNREALHGNHTINAFDV